MSKKSLKQHEAKMERFARPGETKVKDIAKLVRKSLGKKPWESSSEEEDAKAERRLSKTPKHVEDDSSSEEARKAHDWTGYSQRRGHQPGIAQRNLAERYKATHGHPGNPPRQRNRYFAGVSKTEWSGLKGRTRKRRS
jgi:hypothetical protein